MSKIQKKIEYSRFYNNFLGLSLSENPSNISEMRFSHMENMYRDYQGNDGAAVETIPGYRRLKSFSYDGMQRKINAIFHYIPKGELNEYVIVHAGKSLFRFLLSDMDNSVPLSPIGRVFTDKNGVEHLDFTPLSDEKSKIFEFDGKVWILDGENLSCLDGDRLRYACDMAYIPTTYSDSEAYEQKNLLTDSFRCVYHISSVAGSLTRLTKETSLLTYKIMTESTCILESMNSDAENVYIPSSTVIDGRTYLIEEIAPYAFRNNSTMVTLTIAEGVKHIGYGACFGCSSLKKATLPNSVESLGNGVFMNCTAIREVCIGYNIEKIPMYCFHATNLSHLKYSGTKEQWDNLTVESMNSALTSCNFTYEYADKSGSFVFLLNEKCKEIDSVTLDSVELTQDDESLSYSILFDSEYISSILLNTSDYSKITGKELVISGRSDYRFSLGTKEHKSINQIYPNYSGSSYEVISHCKVCCTYDGRVFFSGNPKFPSCVFYSAKSSDGISLPEYIGFLNYFSVGRTDSAITALLPSGNNLIVFKEDNESGGIYIYSPSDTQYDIIPRIYLCSESISGVGAVGAVCNFYDDTVFLSDRGLDAITKKSLNYEYGIEHRSSNIDLALLRTNIKDANMCRWLGYLIVAIGDEVFLGDSRRTFRHNNGSIQYEWYRLFGIGTYQGQYSKYHYAITPKEFEGLCILYDGIYLKVEEKEGELKDSRDVCSSYAYTDNENGYGETEIKLYYTVEKDEDGLLHCYLCDSDGEMTGGTYYPASAFCNINELLFFGTGSGDLCCFNTDKRDEVGNIEKKYYTFDNRRYTSAFTTAFDNCGIPHLTKSTVKRSLCLHLKTFGGGRINLAVRTDKTGWKKIAEAQGQAFAFDDVEFDNLSFNTSQRVILPLSEKEKRWTEKQYRIFSDDYKRPFGIFDMSYRYRVAGRIKE